MSQDPQAALAAELARDVVAELAPHELPLFQPISQAYFADPGRAARAGSGRDEMLGFGVAGAEALITPALLTIASQVVAFVLDQVKDTASQEGSALAVEWVRWVFGRARPPAVATAVAATGIPAGLTAAQIARVRELVIKRAAELRLPATKAELLADSVAGKLVVAPA